MPTVASVARKIKKDGEPLVLKRQGVADLPFIGKVNGYEPADIVGDIQQGDREVRMSNDEITDLNWPGPPIQGDRVFIRTKASTVKSVDTIMLGVKPAMHVVRVRG